MATIGTLTAQAQKALANVAAGTWPDDTVQAWVWEAIQDYSTYFHRTHTTTIACGDGDHDYDLPNDFMDMLLVEYPDGEDPPEYLLGLSRQDPDFWLSDDYYDVEPSDQSNDVDAVLWIAAETATGETIRITYRRHYYDPLGVDDPETLIYVPEPHHPILIQYVVWRATTERYAYEIQQADSSSVILEQLAHGAERQRAIYERMIDRATAQLSRSQFTPPWRNDAYDPIY